MHDIKAGLRMMAARALRAGLAIAFLLGTMIPAAAPGQYLANDRTPYGSPFGSSRYDDDSNRGARSTSRDTPTSQGVDPSGGTSEQRFEPIQIEGRNQRQERDSSDEGSDRDNRRSDETKLVKPPAKPNEFEQFIENAVGRKLERFGGDLILPSDRDFAVPATATIPPDYVLNVGDSVTISLTGSTEGSVERQIDTDGRIFLPRVGEIRVAGVRYGDLQRVVSRAVGTQYRGYEVSVAIRRLRGIRVYVTGFANNPGAFTVNSLSTMLNAVFAAGGPASGGSLRSIKLYRRGQLVKDFDLYDLLLRGDRRNDAILQNEDTLVIPAVGPQVAVTGSVNSEAVFELKPGETLADILSFAGGTGTLADKTRVLLYKLEDRVTSGSRELAVGTLASMPAANGDLLQVLSEGGLQQPVSRQAAVVKVEGEVNKPGNYYVTAGTTIAQVMELAGGPTNRAYMFGSRVERQSVRRQQRQGYKDSIDQLELTLGVAPLTGSTAIDAGTRDTQLNGIRALITKLRETEPDGRIVLDIAPDATALPGEIMVENNDHIVVPQRATTVGVFGAVYRPASFLFREDRPGRVRDYLAQAGGASRAADEGHMFLIRANGSVVPRSKGALSARVLPGDVIFIPVKTQNGSLLARLVQIVGLVSQVGLTAASLAVIAR